MLQLDNRFSSGFLGLAALLALAAGCGKAEGGADRGPVEEDAGVVKDGGGAGSGGGSGDSGIDSSMVSTEETCADVMCHDKASCNDSSGEAKCRCNAGYVGDGTTCDDIDECNHPTVSKCDDNATCKNLAGSFSCACKAGFLGDGNTCTDVNECMEGLKACSIDATCKNTAGGAQCKCKAGFHDDDGECVDDDECAVGADNPLTCDANADCNNTPGGAFCECDAGYHNTAAAGDPVVCAANAACTVATQATDCDDQATCNGSNVCVCLAGYEGDGAPNNCTNINECDEDMDTCSSAATCTDATPGYTCACKDGFEDKMPGNAGRVCEDIDECDEGDDDCDDDATCTNNTGGFTCTCPTGFEDVNGDGTSCVPSNECSAPDLNDCHENADCTDKTPGYTCKCKDGFEGDGKVHCDNIDECADSTKNDCENGETCSDYPGTYQCGCNAPFVKSGGKCYCDLTGYWAMRQRVTTTWPAVKDPIFGTDIIKAGSYETYVWELHRMRYDGDTLPVDKKGCGPEGTPDLIGAGNVAGETYGTYIPQSTWNAFGLLEGVDVSLAAAVPGDDFVTPKEAVVLGLTLGNPLTDNWPSLANATRTDPDGDGVDGLMVWPRTPSMETHASTPSSKKYYDYAYVSLSNRVTCATTASRVINHLDGKLDACDKISGTVIRDKAPGQSSPAVQARVYACRRVGANSAAAGQDQTCTKSAWDNGTACSNSERDLLDQQLDTQTVTATFDMLKISGNPDANNITCAMVKAALPVP